MTIDRAAEKQKLRKEMLARRRALSAEERFFLRQGLTRQVLALPQYQKARCILAYLALPGEADLDDVIRAALAGGKEVYVPVCLADKQMEAGRIVDMDHFVPGPYGLRDLPAGYASAPPEAMDLVLVPAVACDRQGGRLGHGAGYYDRYLPCVPEERRIGVIWDCQIADKVPEDPFDQKLCGFVTETRIVFADHAKGV